MRLLDLDKSEALNDWRRFFVGGTEQTSFSHKDV